MKKLSMIATGSALLLASAISEAKSLNPVKCETSPTEKIAVSPKPPCDLPKKSKKKQLDYARFAWSTFISMNWPAHAASEEPYRRGLPKGKKFENADTVVWDSWREKRELYQIRATKNTFNTKLCNSIPESGPPEHANGLYYYWKKPEVWDIGRAPSSKPINPQIPMCKDETLVNPDKGVLQLSKIDDTLDESDEIGLAVLWQDNESKDPPNEDNLIRYQVKYNYDYYEYVRKKRLWCTTEFESTLKTRSYSEEALVRNVGKVNLPQGSIAQKRTGAILTKSAWKKLSNEEIESGKFYMRDSLYYSGSKKRPCYKAAKFGLIGLHIIRKTDTAPYFLYTTFEHKGNYPNKFNYANTLSKASDAKNPYGITYGDPANNYQKTGEPKEGIQFPPYQANRLLRIHKDVAKANKEAAKLTKKTVWSNYQLVGLQYKPVNAPENAKDNEGQYFQKGFPSAVNKKGKLKGDGFYPAYFENQSYYLANPVIETNQALQFFTGGFGKPEKPNVALYRFSSSKKPNGKSVNMGGCMGCHGNAQLAGADFSFTLNNQLHRPKSFSVENLAQKCKEIGLNYNKAEKSCE